ncbi:MAG: tetratricopeptide repeat protein [Cyanobacteria bacterium J06639_18]
MPVITIREERKTDHGFEVCLSFDGAEYSVSVIEPFTPKEEKELEWYFEDWVRFPFTDTTIAQRAASSISSYGESLFQQVFKADFDAYSAYRQLRGNLSQLQIEIVSKTPEFHGLHWEAIADPDLPRPLAVDCIMVRKSIKPTSTSTYVESSPVINLLVVTARPDEEDDVGYRTISRPLIELIENCQLQINVDLLRPATYQALCEYLEAKGTGFYHVIHFDCHGALMEYGEIEEGVQRNRYVYQNRYGRYDLEPYDGVKAFLFLEGESKGEADPVEAQELADLLTGKGIPVCILNACQSAKQVKSGDEGDEKEQADSRETSLGSRLMTAGMQMVVAMGYSVTVSAAAIVMEQLYRHLFNNKSINEAIRLGRGELFRRKGRKAYFNKTIDLEDWLLPLVYTNKAVNFNLREFTPEEEEEYFESVSSKFSFLEPEYGFVGRDLAILKIEKALLRHNILLLQGMGGTGKTTLLNYLRQWWQITSFTQDVFYFAYDHKAWTLTQILFDIGKSVYNKDEFGRFQAMDQQAQVAKLVKTLRSENYTVVLDNFESVTGEELAIQNTLNPEQRQEIQGFLTKLVGGKTYVVIGSRSNEKWLQKTTFKQNVYQLRGLDRESRTVLAEKILERHVSARRIPKIREDDDFQQLMKVLAGYPLAMQVVLANLRNQSPKEILAAVQAGDVNLDSDSTDKTASIIKCVEYSHSNLSDEAQQLLLCLAPFSGFIYRSTISVYVEELKKLAAFKDYHFDEFDDAIQAAIDWGLLSPINYDLPNLLNIHPLFPYFLEARLKELDREIREALREGFKNYYRRLAVDYGNLMESKDPQERQLGIAFCGWEYENLYHALQICLEKQENVVIFFCLSKYFALISDFQSQLKLSEFVCKTHEAYPSDIRTGEIRYEIILILGSLANCYLKTQNYQQAKEFYQKVIEQLQQLSGVEATQIKSNLAVTYHNLGRVAQQLREFEQAKNNYQQTLDIYIRFGDRYHCASTYHNLGSVAQKLGEFEEAKNNYQQALEIYAKFSNCDECAHTCYQLGRVAEELREFEQARNYYRQALEIYIEFGDRYGCARTYEQLGLLAEELENFVEAKVNLLQALEIFAEFNDKHSLAIVLSHLARIYKTTKDESILQAVAQLFGVTVEEVREVMSNE